ncbi:cyclic AMP-responsive element-binding protein 3-like protein 4 [Carettochelys insculpta]|uniref:cyclic AMP-responsive element-binding protein 3-like protein 4 n=1 Tax=Carettochelys insculpta TaxID=44489 RepID=UPI003EBCC156
MAVQVLQVHVTGLPPTHPRGKSWPRPDPEPPRSTCCCWALPGPGALGALLRPQGRLGWAGAAQDAEILLRRADPVAGGCWRCSWRKTQMAQLGSPTLPALVFEEQEDLSPSGPFPSPAAPWGPAEQPLGPRQGSEQWAASALSDGEPQAVLCKATSPSTAHSAGSTPPSPDSSCGLWEEPGEGAPACYTDICAQSAPLPSPSIAIQQGDWSPPLLISDTCIVNELPLAAAGPGTVPVVLSAGDTHTVVPLLHFPALFLTEEEKRLLSQEGVSLPSALPLTKAEERLLKKVRRKIRNKQSAQDSRRRKKEYVDGLESRVASSSAQNQELQKQVQELEKCNMSLLSQLRKLQALIRPTSSKAAQTSTCILILLISLALLISPSYSPLHGGARGTQGNSAPTGVISRNILNQRESSEPAEAPSTQEPSAAGPEPAPGEQLVPKVAAEARAEGAYGGATPLGAGSKNMSVQAHLEQPMGLPQGTRLRASRAAVKAGHAEEM